MNSSGFIMVQRDCVQQTAVQTTPLLIFDGEDYNIVHCSYVESFSCLVL